MFLKKINLAERVRKDFSRVKLANTFVKVPKIKTRKIKSVIKSKTDSIPVSILVNILIRNALDKIKREKQKPHFHDGKYRLVKKDDHVQGGYGNVSKNYGSLMHSPYVDYGRLFSYLGKFKAKNPYDSDIPTHILGTTTESKSFELVSREAMDKGARYVKYFMSHVSDLNMGSLVAPTAAMSSGEWEQFKLLMQFDKVMYRLKTSTV